MRLRIVDDGTVDGLKVTDAETGETITGINYVVYEKDPANPARVMLGMSPESVDLVVDNVDILKDSPSLEPVPVNGSQA